MPPRPYWIGKASQAGVGGMCWRSYWTASSPSLISKMNALDAAPLWLAEDVHSLVAHDELAEPRQMTQCR
jgi:hypothetical protein